MFIRNLRENILLIPFLSQKATLFCQSYALHVPLCWQIYARHGKASGQTFFFRQTNSFYDRSE